jgi:1-acyl-sn-glycerol-3-phosphate acyltransferase
MKLCGVLPIDRGNRSAVMQVYANAESRVEKGEVFALAPEGTRQNEAAIGKFKRGPFEFAINAKATIVPVTLAGVYEVLPKSSIWLNLGRWKRNVLMEIGTPVPAQEWPIEKVDELQARVRQEMVATFTRLHSEIY